MLKPIDPWNFSNGDENLVSFDGSFRLEYSALQEIAMGSPLMGECFLITPTNEKIVFDFLCGGPAVWAENSNKLAMPIWVRSIEGTLQQIVIVDAEARTQTIYKQTFRVLDLKAFEMDKLYGYDSPIFNTKTLDLDLSVMEVESVKSF